MSGLGPAPKETPLGHGRSSRVFRRLRADGVLRGPELDTDGPDGHGWHPCTRQWWHAWRTSPQARLFWHTEWSELLDTAALHHALWTRQRIELASEIRLRVAKLGATPEDRMRLRVHCAPHQERNEQ